MIRCTLLAFALLLGACGHSDVKKNDVAKTNDATKTINVVTAHLYIAKVVITFQDIKKAR